MNYFYARDLWQLGRMPEVPTPFPEPPLGLTNGQITDWQTAGDLLALGKLKDAKRRSIDGVNRAAQYRMPDRGIRIGFTEAVLTTWQLAGLPALRDMISEGRQLLISECVYFAARNSLKCMAVAAMRVPPKGEVIVPGRTLVQQVKEPGAPVLVWAVAVEATYGNYAFHLLSQQEPDWHAVGYLCLWHTLKV